MTVQTGSFGWPPSSPTSLRSITIPAPGTSISSNWNGSIELAPILGLSDVIVDIVETGKTLLENHLAPLETFVDISARFICNKVSYKFKHEEIIRLRDALERDL